MSSKHEELKFALNAANETLKSTHAALRVLGLLRKVDYKMLQQSQNSIREYYKTLGQFEEEEILGFSEDNEFDFNKIDFKDEDVVKSIFLNANYYIMSKLHEAKNHPHKTILANIGNSIVDLTVSTIFSIWSWHHPELGSKLRDNEEKDKMFKRTIKTIGRHLIKFGNIKENSMGDPRNKVMHDFK